MLAGFQPGLGLHGLVINLEPDPVGVHGLGPGGFTWTWTVVELNLTSLKGIFTRS